MSDSSPPPEPTVPEPEPPAAAPTPAASGTSRRWFLAGGVAVLVGGGAGVAVELLGRSEPARPAAAPAALVAAVHAERGLIADLDATTGGTAPVRAVIAQARIDHAAHLSALRGVLAGYPATEAVRSRPHGRPRTRAQLRAAERDAARVAARHADALGGATAALLASIAACEATHAELLR